MDGDKDGGLVDCIDITSDSRRIAAVGKDRKIKIYDRKTGQIRELNGFSAFPNWIRFSPDESRMIGASIDGKVRMIITETGDEVYSWDVKTASWATGEFAHDGNSVAVGGFGYLLFIDAQHTDDQARLSNSEIRSRTCEKTSEVKW